jgi:hypothetical protein
MLIFFLVYFSPCNAGLYSPVRVKNELEKKINIARGKSHKKNIYGAKPKLAHIAGGY